MPDLIFKEHLYEACHRAVQERIDLAQSMMDRAQAAANEETKSSVGDKYETGRAMMQRERDKAKARLAEALNMKAVLDQLPVAVVEDKVAAFGSFVETNRGRFFISVGLGTIKMPEGTVFAVSVPSPIGQKLLDCGVGDAFEVNGNRFEVLGVV